MTQTTPDAVPFVARTGTEAHGWWAKRPWLRVFLGGLGLWVATVVVTFNLRPDVTVATTYVTWNRDGRTLEADNGGGSFVSHTFNTPGNQNIGFGPRIAVAAGKVFVGWTTGTSPQPRAFVAERVGSSWTGTFASPSSATRTQVLAGVAPSGGLATAVILSLESRLYATNEA